MGPARVQNGSPCDFDHASGIPCTVVCSRRSAYGAFNTYNQTNGFAATFQLATKTPQTPEKRSGCKEAENCNHDEDRHKLRPNAVFIHAGSEQTQYSTLGIKMN